MKTGDRPDRRRSRVRVSSILAAVVIAVFVAGCGGGDDADPAAVVEAYRVAYNEKDLFAVMDLFAEDAVMTGHPFAARAEGIAELTRIQREDIDFSAQSDAYQFVNVRVEGTTVTFDHVWHSADGRCVTGEGQKLVVEDGKIVRWDWGSGGIPCE